MSWVWWGRFPSPPVLTHNKGSGRQCQKIVPPGRLSHLIGKHLKMRIHYEVHHFVSGRALELLAKPVHRQISGCHGIEQEILEILEVLRREEVLSHGCFVHAPTIADSG